MITFHQLCTIQVTSVCYVKYPKNYVYVVVIKNRDLNEKWMLFRVIDRLATNE